MRVKFYREHKYVSAALNKLERLIAKTDFKKNKAIKKALDEWTCASFMLEQHAEYEETKLHPLLKIKGSTVYLDAHHDHEALEATFNSITRKFQQALEEKDTNMKIEIGYDLYLSYRKFVGENLLHLYEEETKILPELQRLYTDEELRKVEHATYITMSPKEMLDMLKVLFPHMNTSDKKYFVKDLELAQPKKFAEIKTEVSKIYK